MTLRRPATVFCKSLIARACWRRRSANASRKASARNKAISRKRCRRIEAFASARKVSLLRTLRIVPWIAGSFGQPKGLRMNDQFVLLLLEDSEEDIFLFQRAVAKVGRSVAFQ